MKNYAKLLLAMLIAFFIIPSTLLAQSPTATISARALDFGGQLVTTSSSPQMAIMNASYLSPSSGYLTVVVGSSAYEVWNGSSWISSYTISYTGATVSSETILVRFSPASVASFCGNVSVTGGGLASVLNISVVGIGTSSSSSSTCSGTPSIGSVSAWPDSGCGAFTSSLGLLCTSLYGGVSVQWQSSATGSSWANISGATTLSYNAAVTSGTYFRCVATCASSSGTASSSALFVSTTSGPSLAAISGPSTLSAGSGITLSNSTGGGVWSSSAPGIATVNSSTGAVWGSATGSATISYAVSNSCGTTTVTKPVTVTASLGVAEHNNGFYFDITPNPATNSVVMYSSSQKVSVRLLNMTGYCLYQAEMEPSQNGELHLSMDDCPAGIYLVEAIANGQKVVKKLTKL